MFGGEKKETVQSDTFNIMKQTLQILMGQPPGAAFVLKKKLGTMRKLLPLQERVSWENYVMSKMNI